MGLFRKHILPEQLGAMVYESLRAGMESAGDLSMEAFLVSLERSIAEKNEQYQGEIIVSLMFGAMLAVERSASSRVAARITGGMKLEFLRHLEEQGASQLQRSEWEAVLADRFLAYRQCLEDYSGFEPPWKLGRQFYWNLLGTEDHTAIKIKIATLYVLAARDHSQAILNEYGPSVLVD